MAQLPSEKPSEIKVEDLLRLKRSERPDEAFWGKFDRDLHQRMLQTLVKRDPWYQRVGQLLAGHAWGRILPIAGGASAAAFAVFMVMHSGSPAVGPETAGAQMASVIAVPMAEAAAYDESNVEAMSLGGALSELSYLDVSDRAQSREYGIDVISARSDVGGSSFKREFEMDRIQVASSDRVSYSEDSLTRGTLAAAGVSSFVY